MQILTPDIKTLESFSFPRASREPFSDDVLLFIEAISKRLTKEDSYRQFEELVALGFWLRRSHINSLKKRFFKHYVEDIVMPRGVVFHIAPSNVDTIFLYSFVLSLLVGNHNIVRITQKENPQIEPLLSLVVEELKNFPNLYNSTLLIRYGHEDSITQELSKLCDVRVIWGGDATIEHIRKIPIKPTAIELTFADKFSFFAIKLSQVVLDENFYEKLYRDSFTFLQNACSSIRAICFIDTSSAEKKLFWNGFYNFIEMKRPQLEAKTQIDKLIALTSLAIENETITLSFQPFMSVVKLPNLEAIDEQKHCGGGLFYDIDIKNLEELFSYSTKKDQTLSLAGITEEELHKAFKQSPPQGFDRVVSVGKAMEFNAVWDGFDIMSSLSRIVDVDL